MQTRFNIVFYVHCLCCLALCSKRPFRLSVGTLTIVSERLGISLMSSVKFQCNGFTQA